jgi:hypothetical protein
MQPKCLAKSRSGQSFIVFHNNNDSSLFLSPLSWMPEKNTLEQSSQTTILLAAVVVVAFTAKYF